MHASLSRQSRNNCTCTSYSCSLHLLPQPRTVTHESFRNAPIMSLRRRLSARYSRSHDIPEILKSTPIRLQSAVLALNTSRDTRRHRSCTFIDRVLVMSRLGLTQRPFSTGCRPKIGNVYDGSTRRQAARDTQRANPTAAYTGTAVKLTFPKLRRCFALQKPIQIVAPQSAGIGGIDVNPLWGH